MIGTCYRLINSPVPGYGFTDASIEKLGRYVCITTFTIFRLLLGVLLVI